MDYGPARKAIHKHPKFVLGSKAVQKSPCPPVNVTAMMVKVELGGGELMGAGKVWADTGVTPPLARRPTRTPLTRDIRMIAEYMLRMRTLLINYR